MHSSFYQVPSSVFLVGTTITFSFNFTHHIEQDLHVKHLNSLFLSLSPLINSLSPPSKKRKREQQPLLIIVATLFFVVHTFLNVVRLPLFSFNVTFLFFGQSMWLCHMSYPKLDMIFLDV